MVSGRNSGLGIFEPEDEMGTKFLWNTPLLLFALGNFAAAQNKPSPVGGVDVSAGTLDTASNRAGDTFSAILNAPVVANGSVIVPKGTPFRGHLTAAKPSGRLKGRGYLTVTLDSFELNGQSYPVAASSHTGWTASHKKRNWAMIGGGSGFGALVGGLAGGAKGLLIGGGAGAAAGTATAVFTGRKQVRMPAESILTFRLHKDVWIRGNSPHA
jgi:hypothetical protein